MDLFKTKLRRKILFASLYFSEGAPIGFIWLALPTRLRASDVPIEKITWLAAILVLPWTFKFAWAPLIDWLRSNRWTFRNWVIAAQIVMGLTLLPLLWINPLTQFFWLAIVLLCHAFAAATQDVAIDALCISSTSPGERGEYNGWMQTGMMLGRAAMGGGALVLSRYFGYQTVVGLLILTTTFSMALILFSRPPHPLTSEIADSNGRAGRGLAIKNALSDPNTWIGLAFAVVGGAAFKSLEVIYGPFLIDRGMREDFIGWFSMGPMIGAMIAGTIAGGFFADRIGAKKCVLVSLIAIVLTISTMAIGDTGATLQNSIDSIPINWFLLGCLTTTALVIGAFTSASYALFMDISRPAIAATQFSAFMGATNGCESWSSFVSGKLIANHGYPTALLTMCAISLCAIPLVVGLKHEIVLANKKSELVPCKKQSNGD